MTTAEKLYMKGLQAYIAHIRADVKHYLAQAKRVQKQLDYHSQMYETLKAEYAEQNQKKETNP